MGRLFRPARVYQTAQKSLAIPVLPKLQDVPPPWLKVVEAIPPAEILTRPVPVQHQPPNPRMRRPRRTFRPQQITYEEDELRKTFFKDHPWELARPRIIMELDGKDSRHIDWSTGLRQPGVPLSGECVVQRQLWLMHNKCKSKEEAYDEVRREFYAIRQQEEVETRIAQEEARMVGGYFGKTRLQVSMELEDQQYEKWKTWAASETAKIEAERNQASAMFGKEDAPPLPEEKPEEKLDEDLERMVQ